MSKLQLYSLATPNGKKASIALEEMELNYDAHRIDILEGDQFEDSFIKINPNSKIPALVDPEGDNGKPLNIMESGAILIYLANKSGRFLSKDPVERNRTLQWLFFQVGHVGPMFGQFGHFFKYAKDKCEHPYPVERYTKESKRLLGVIDEQLERSKYIAGSEISIADFAIAPWVDCLDEFYNAKTILELDKFKKVNAWLEEIKDRPGVKRGWNVCPVEV